jgi:hypothetical protein
MWRDLIIFAIGGGLVIVVLGFAALIAEAISGEYDR